VGIVGAPGRMGQAPKMGALVFGGA